MLSMLPSIVILGILALVALNQSRESPAQRMAERSAAARVLTLTTAMQSVHFAEEWLMDFHERFPALFGQPAMPLTLFVAFNALLLAVWLAAIPGIRRGKSPAFPAAWFLALAGMLNGVAHPLLAVIVGGYFPGLVSSPFIGAAGVWLWLTLQRATR